MAKMGNEAEWKRNEISKKYLEIIKRINVYFLFLGGGFLIIFPFLLSMIFPFNMYKLLFLEVLAIFVTSFSYLNSRFAYLNNPKYIKWDDKGIYMISFRDKESFIPWDEIRWIKKMKEIDPKADYTEDFVLEKKSGWFDQYVLEHRIGEDILKEWLKHKEEYS